MVFSRTYMNALVISLLVILSPASVLAEEWKGTVASNGATAYSRMDSGSPSVGQLRYGAHVIVNWESTMSDGKWCGLKDPKGFGTLGYVKCGYLVKGFVSKDQLRNMPTRSVDGRPTVLLYMRYSCPWCKKALALLRQMDVNLVIYETDKDPVKKNEMYAKGGRGVPFIDVEGIYIPGYNKEAIVSAVEMKQGRR